MPTYTVNNTKRSYTLRKSGDKKYSLKQTVKEYKVQSRGLRGLPGSDGDKHFQQIFNAEDDLLITHNLGKLPAVTVINSANDEIVGDVTNINPISLRIKFAYPESGTVYLN